MPQKPHKQRGPKAGFKRSDTPEQLDRRYLPEGRKKLIVNLLAQGTPIIQTAEIVRSSQETVRNVEETYSESIELRRKQLAGRLHVIVGPVLDRIHRQVLDDNFQTSTKDLAITGGILLDKYDKMTGQPSQIIKVEHTDPGREEYQRWISATQIDVEST